MEDEISERIRTMNGIVDTNHTGEVRGVKYWDDGEHSAVLMGTGSLPVKGARKEMNPDKPWVAVMRNVDSKNLPSKIPRVGVNTHWVAIAVSMSATIGALVHFVHLNPLFYILPIIVLLVSIPKLIDKTLHPSVDFATGYGAHENPCYIIDGRVAYWFKTGLIPLQFAPSIVDAITRLDNVTKDSNGKYILSNERWTLYPVHEDSSHLYDPYAYEDTASDVIHVLLADDVTRDATVSILLAVASTSNKNTAITAREALMGLLKSQDDAQKRAKNEYLKEQDAIRARELAEVEALESVAPDWSDSILAVAASVNPDAVLPATTQREPKKTLRSGAARAGGLDSQGRRKD